MNRCKATRWLYSSTYEDIPAERMQRIAREMNLSETTFVLPPCNGGDWRVRIFTPVNELPFVGYPLLGSAIVLCAVTDKDQLHLETRMGIVPFELERQNMRSQDVGRIVVI